jgi:hypothetical protein
MCLASRTIHALFQTLEQETRAEFVAGSALPCR